MRKGTPAQLIKEIEDKIEELKEDSIDSSCNTAKKSSVKAEKIIVDEPEEVIEADDNVEEFNPEDEEDSAVETEGEYVKAEDRDEEISEDDYLASVYHGVEDQVKDLVRSVAWSGDDDNIYMDANFVDGRVISFTIPREDLTHDINSKDRDIDYICVAVRGEDSEDETSYNMEDYYDEADRPAYQ